MRLPPWCWFVVSSFLLSANAVTLAQEAAAGSTSARSPASRQSTAKRQALIEKENAALPVDSTVDGLDQLQLKDRWVDEKGDIMTGTLILSPAGDQALDISTGSIYKGGALFIHTRGGSANTALGSGALTNVTTGGRANTANGYRALYNDTSGAYNTATGKRALYSNTGGGDNSAFGELALGNNTSGFGNTACGLRALEFNTLGNENTAIGRYALRNNTGGYNTALGHEALYSNTTGEQNVVLGGEAMYYNTTGNGNTAFGYSALESITTGNYNVALGYQAGFDHTLADSDNIDIGNLGTSGESGVLRIGTAGTHTEAFVAGIRGVTTGMADAVGVMIDSTGQLGTVSSSRRFKEGIDDMGDATDRLLRLRPVLFRYKQAFADGEKPIQYGLVAEEVAEVLPELVVYDDEGRPETVKYHLLGTMLLNELQKEHQRIADLEAKDRVRDAEVAAIKERLAWLEQRE